MNNIIRNALAGGRANIISVMEDWVRAPWLPDRAHQHDETTHEDVVIRSVVYCSGVPSATVRDVYLWAERCGRTA